MSLEVVKTPISMPEIKSAILRLLREDEEFRLAVAGLLGLNTILEELKKLREDFNNFVKIQEERWLESGRRFNEFVRMQEERWQEAERRFNEFVKMQEERWLESERRFNEFVKMQEERWLREEERWREAERRFSEFVKMNEERWQEAFKRFSRLELELGAVTESMYSRYFWDDLREELKSSGEILIEKSRSAVVDSVEVDMLVVTDRNVYVVEVKVKPTIGDVGALLAKAEVVSSKLGKPSVPVLTGALIGGDVRAYAESKGVKVHSY